MNLIEPFENLIRTLSAFTLGQWAVALPLLILACVFWILALKPHKSASSL